MILEWGYFDRINKKGNPNVGHWQLSPDHLNNPPQGDYPSDRFNAVGLGIQERDPVPDGYVLLCGQVPEDAAVLDVDYPAWLKGQWDYYTARGERVLFRPHPRAVTQPFNSPPELTNRGDLKTALAGAKFVVCYNSNTGHDALLAGVPVVCDPVAPYAELSGETCPSVERRQHYFSRAAYGQWRHSEIVTGFIETLKRMGYGSRI